MCKQTGKSKVVVEKEEQGMNECNCEFGKTLYNFGIYYAVMQGGKEYA